MTIRTAIETAFPGVGLVRLALYAIACLALAGLVGWIGWKLLFAERAAQAKHDVVQAETQGRVGAAQGDAGANAANVVAGSATKETIIRETTRTNYVEITKQPGANDPVSDAVDAAGRRAICLRASAASLPDCQRLQEAGP